MMSREHIISQKITLAYALAGFEVPNPELLMNMVIQMSRDLGVIPDSWLERVFDHARVNRKAIPQSIDCMRSWRDEFHEDWRKSQKINLLPTPSQATHNCQYCMVVAWRLSEWSYNRHGIARSIPFTMLSGRERDIAVKAPTQAEQDCFYQTLDTASPKDQLVLQNYWHQNPYTREAMA